MTKNRGVTEASVGATLYTNLHYPELPKFIQLRTEPNTYPIDIINHWCPGPDLNWHARFHEAQDFKSCITFRLKSSTLLAKSNLKVLKRRQNIVGRRLIVHKSALSFSNHNFNFQHKNSPGETMDFVEISVRKFETLIKRKEIKSPQWFAMPNEILSHPDFFDVTGDEFKVFTWIMGIAAKLNTATIRVYPELCAHQARVSKKTVELTISKLNGKRWDDTRTIHARDVNVSLQDSTGQDRGVQDSTGHTLGSSNRLIELWNKHCLKLPKVEVESADRVKKSKALLKKYGEENLIDAIARVAASDFCNGLGTQGWVFDFDFFLRPATYPKIVEGKYDNRKAKPAQLKNSHLLSLLDEKKVAT